MKRWPPIVYVLVSVGSLLVLVGVGGDWNPEAFWAGTGAIGLAMILGFYLAYGAHRDRPRPRGLNWLVGAVAGYYAVCAVIGAFAGTGYALAAVGASVIPLTAAALLVATVRGKTAGREGRRFERSAAADEDPYPGIGIDDETPLGDTDQHSDARA